MRALFILNVIVPVVMRAFFFVCLIAVSDVGYICVVFGCYFSDVLFLCFSFLLVTFLYFLNFYFMAELS